MIKNNIIPSLNSFYDCSKHNLKNNFDQLQDQILIPHSTIIMINHLTSR